MRVVGASCGAFVGCFGAILLSLPILLQFGQAVASLVWLGGLILGAFGGAMFPRLGHFLGYAFIIFLNIMLSLTIGRNPKEQAALFGIFLFVELVFLMTHLLTKPNRR